MQAAMAEMTAVARVSSFYWYQYNTGLLARNPTSTTVAVLVLVRGDACDLVLVLPY